MNNRFKLALRLLNSRHNKGFAMVIAFMIGAIMLMTGAVIMTRATSDKSKVLSQKKKVEAASIVEAGVTQYMAALNNNQKIATYPACINDGACPEGTESWSDAVSILEAATDWPTTYCSTDDDSSDDGSDVNVYTNPAKIASYWGDGEWKDIAGIGHYKLIDYSYMPDNVANGVNSTPGTATLVLRGTTETDPEKLSDEDDGEGISQVQVTFRVTSDAEGEKFFPDGPPGLWAQSFDLNGTNKNEDFETNVLNSSDCDSGTTAFPEDRLTKTDGSAEMLPPPFEANTAASYSQKKQSFPDLPNNNVYAEPTNNYNQVCLGDGSRTFPQTGDVASDGTAYGTAPVDAIYLYVHKSSCNTAKSKLTGGEQHTYGVSGQETIKIY